MRRALTWLVFLAVLVWGTLLTAGIGIIQRDSYAPFALTLADIIWQILVAFAIIAAGAGVGLMVIHICRLALPTAERWILALLVGPGLLGAVWLWLALIYVPLLPFVLLLLAAAWVALACYRPPLPSLPILSLPLRLYLFIILALPFTIALAPPTAFDALMYHLRVPELWLATNSLYEQPREAQFFFPMGVEALYTIALQLAGSGAAQLLHWFYFPLLLALLWRSTRRFLPSVSPQLVLIITLSIPMLATLAGWAYTDLPLAAYQVGMLVALLYWHQDKAQGWLWVAALCAGLAVSIKYLAVLTPLIAIIFILVHNRRALPLVFPFGLLGGVVAAPSYLRNWIATGNPVFPFAFPTPYWDAARASWYAAAGTGIGLNPLKLLTLPFNATLGIGDANIYDGRTGPLIVMLIGLALWLLALRQGETNERRIVITFLIVALAYITLWGVGVVSSAALWQSRFLLTPYLLLTPVVAWGASVLADFDHPRFAFSAVLRLFITGWAAFALLIALAEWNQVNPLAVILNPRLQSEWTQQRLGTFPQLVAQTQTLPTNARLVLFFEPRSYSMPVTTYPDTILDQFTWRLNRAGGDVAMLQASLCAEGYTHAALSWRGATFLRDESTVNPLPPATYDSLVTWSQGQRFLWRDAAGGYELFELDCNVE